MSDQIILNWTTGGIFIGLMFARMLAVGGTVQALKKAVDTEIDPETQQAATVFVGTTTRGVRAVTQEDLRKFATGEFEPAEVDEWEDAPKTTLTANPSKTRVFRRPLWFTRLLPLIPLVLGGLYGALLLPISVSLSGMVHWPLPDPDLAVAVGVLVGVGEGASSGQLYKAWDNMDGWEGLLRFSAKTFESVVKRATGQNDTPK